MQPKYKVGDKVIFQDLSYEGVAEILMVVVDGMFGIEYHIHNPLIWHEEPGQMNYMLWEEDIEGVQRAKSRDEVR